MVEEPWPVREKASEENGKSGVMFRKWLFWIGQLCLAVLFLAPTSPVDAQVKQWVDKDGVVHYEMQGQGAPERFHPSASRALIDRTHGNYALGDDISPLRKPGRSLAFDKRADGIEIVVFLTLPAGSSRGVGYFSSGRLAVMFFVYTGSALGGWDALIATTSKKYGEASLKAHDTATWRDAMTVLNFQKKYDGTIEALIGDAATIDRILNKSVAPKF